MDHVITAQDVLEFLLAVVSLASVAGIFVYVLSIVAGGYEH